MLSQRPHDLAPSDPGYCIPHPGPDGALSEAHWWRLGLTRYVSRDDKVWAETWGRCRFCRRSRLFRSEQLEEKPWQEIKEALTVVRSDVYLQGWFNAHD